VGRRKVGGREGFMGVAEIVAGKTQGEEKAWKKGERSWQSVAPSANWHCLGENQRGRVAGFVAAAATWERLQFQRGTRELSSY